MSNMIFDPLEEFNTKYKDLHADNTNKFFEELVERSGVDPEENRKTVQQYNELKENLVKLRKKYNWLRFLRVLMCITLVLIPLVVMKTTPKIQTLRADIEDADKRTEELLADAHNQMLPLNSLFTDRDALDIIEKTIPMMRFHRCFTAEQEMEMKINYDYSEDNEEEQSTVNVLAGSYNENPFLFENKVIHTMGTETYTGSLTIYWTETYRDSNGKLRTRTRSQTLHASVTKPKPFYHTQVVLNYCAQGGPDLSFSRDASHLETRSEKEIQKLVKRGEKKLKKKTDKALKDNTDFQSMANTNFEVLFDALDRDHEVQFRTLFSSLAQVNMTSLILSKDGYGDDFQFIKRKRTNRIITSHSQDRVINLMPGVYTSYEFDTIKENFIGKNVEFFKAVYFDFAPILAIPLYQERPAKSLHPLPSFARLYAFKENEVLANCVDAEHVVHPNTKTQAILKPTFVGSADGVDETCITAYSYDIEKRVDIVSVRGGDGNYHAVPVEWDEYIPLEAHTNFYITTEELAREKDVIARHNGLCIYHIN